MLLHFLAYPHLPPLFYSGDRFWKWIPLEFGREMAVLCSLKRNENAVKQQSPPVYFLHFPFCSLAFIFRFLFYGKRMKVPCYNLTGKRKERRIQSVWMAHKEEEENEKKSLNPWVKGGRAAIIRKRRKEREAHTLRLPGK